MTPWEGLVANRCGPFFVPIFPPLCPPIFSLSGGFYGGKFPKILPSLTPKNFPERGWFFEPKYSKIPLKSPFLLLCAGDDSPRKGFNFEHNRLAFGINSACRTLWKGRRQGRRPGNCWGEGGYEGSPLKEKMNGGNAGDFDGGCRVRRCPLNGKNAGADKQRKIGGKVAEIEFFEVGNHAKNGHLSADKVTKCLDKVFVLKKTLT